MASRPRVKIPKEPITVAIGQNPSVTAAAKLQLAGLKRTEIAEALGVSVYKAKRLLSAAQRNGIIEFFRDYASERFVPKILANIEIALDHDETGEFSLELAKNMGLTVPRTQVEAPPVPEGSFTLEQYRERILLRVSGSTAGRVIDLTPTDTAAVEGASPEGGGGVSESALALPDETGS